MDVTVNDEHPQRWYLFQAIVVVMSLALSLPAILAGYWWDDYYFSNSLIQLEAPFGFYEFGNRLVAGELAPWWTSPDFRINFFRPLSSATLYLDFNVWNASPLFAHLHSAGWFVLLLLGSFRLFRALLPPRVARWAAVIFAVSSCHAFTAGWISARHAVVGGAFSVWSAVYYLSYRQAGKKQDWAVSLALFVVGLLSSETALAVAALVVAYEVAGTSDGWRRRLLAAAPMVGLALIYFVFYKVRGYGAYGSGLYADPMLEPGKFLTGILPKTVSLVGNFVFGIPTSWSFMPRIGWVPLIAGGIGLGLVVVGILFCWRRFEPPHQRLVKWLGLAVLLTIAPSLASLPQGRSVVLSCVAFAALAGFVVQGLWAIRTPWTRRIGPLAIFVLLCLGMVVFSPLLRLGLGAVIYTNSKSQVSLGQAAKVHCTRGARVYLINGSVMFSLQTPFIVAHHRGVFFSGWHQLTEPATDIKVERAGKTSLVISTADEPLVNGFMLNLLRKDPSDLSPGKIIASDHLRCRVLKRSAEGPTRMAFTIPNLHDSNRVCLLYYDHDQSELRNLTLPPLGQSVTIKWHGPKM